MYKEKQHTFCVQKLFSENFAIYEKVEKYSIGGQATDDNMEYAHWIQDT
jgi:hypothetical protein